MINPYLTNIEYLKNRINSIENNITVLREEFEKSLIDKKNIISNYKTELETNISKLAKWECNNLTDSELIFYKKLQNLKNIKILHFEKNVKEFSDNIEITYNVKYQIFTKKYNPDSNTTTIKIINETIILTSPDISSIKFDNDSLNINDDEFLQIVSSYLNFQDNVCYLGNNIKNKIITLFLTDNKNNNINIFIDTLTNTIIFRKLKGYINTAHYEKSDVVLSDLHKYFKEIIFFNYENYEQKFPSFKKHFKNLVLNKKIKPF